MAESGKKKRCYYSSDEDTEPDYDRKKRRYYYSDENNDAGYNKRKRHYSSDEDTGFRRSKHRRRSVTPSSYSETSTESTLSDSYDSSSETSSVSSLTSSSSSRTDSGHESHCYYNSGGGVIYSRHAFNQRMTDRYKPQPNKCIAVFGLNLNTTSLKLRTYFERFGPVEKAEIAREAATGVSKGYGFVYFSHLCDAKYAAEDCEEDIVVDGKKLRIDYSITNPNETK